MHFNIHGIINFHKIYANTSIVSPFVGQSFVKIKLIFGSFYKYGKLKFSLIFFLSV